MLAYLLTISLATAPLPPKLAGCARGGLEWLGRADRVEAAAGGRWRAALGERGLGAGGVTSELFAEVDPAGCGWVQVSTEGNNLEARGEVARSPGRAATPGEAEALLAWAEYAKAEPGDPRDAAAAVPSGPDWPGTRSGLAVSRLPAGPCVPGRPAQPRASWGPAEGGGLHLFRGQALQPGPLEPVGRGQAQLWGDRARWEQVYAAAYDPSADRTCWVGRLVVLGWGGAGARTAAGGPTGLQAVGTHEGRPWALARGLEGGSMALAVDPAARAAWVVAVPAGPEAVPPALEPDAERGLRAGRRRWSWAELGALLADPPRR